MHGKSVIIPRPRSPLPSFSSIPPFSGASPPLRRCPNALVVFAADVVLCLYPGPIPSLLAHFFGLTCTASLGASVLDLFEDIPANFSLFSALPFFSFFSSSSFFFSKILVQVGLVWDPFHRFPYLKFWAVVLLAAGSATAIVSYLTDTLVRSQKLLPPDLLFHRFRIGCLDISSARRDISLANL